MKITDPLAQTFFVEADTGIFVTSLDLYFFTKDPELPLTIQLRPVEFGIPSETVYPFGEIVLESYKVSTSDDGSIQTSVTFPSPVYLKGRQFHSIVLLSNSKEYSIWTSRVGELDVTSLSSQTNSRRVLVSKQPVSGSLYKSQNGLKWIANESDDLKFTLRRAKFKAEGNISFYNSELSLGNSQIATLVKDPLEINSKKIRVGIGTTIPNSMLPNFGNTIVQQGSNATGNFVGYAGSAAGYLNIITAGIGYTPSSGIFTFTNVALSNITGTGKNATANITIQNGVAIGATINFGGSGYVIGDVVSPTQVGIQSLGVNMRLSIPNISGVNELIIDQVQGDFLTGAGKTVQYINSSGIRTDLNGTSANITFSSIEEISDGIHVKVNHKNHGMHSNLNILNLSNVLPDVKPTTLTSNYPRGSTQSIPISDSTNFGTYENVGVGSTNPGYIVIGSEIIAYEGITANSLTGITRSIDQTPQASYDSGTPIYKYELSGVSLRRINKQHYFSDVTVNDKFDLDYYHIKIDMSSLGNTSPLPQGLVDRSVGTSFPKLYFDQTKSTGGSQVNATQNIPFEIITPVIQTMNLNGTDVKGSIRTVSGTSVSGNELSFKDLGFESIDLNESNYLTSPRIIASAVNESNSLTNLPSNKSFELNLNMSSSNEYISPVIDLDRVSVILTSNRINSPISDYINDDRVSTLKDDPSSFVYATNPIFIETPSTSIRLILRAYTNTYHDIRAFYAITEDPQSELIYFPFPGYNNINSIGRMIDKSQSDGSPDKFVPKTDKIGFESTDLVFNDFEFSVDSLPSFRYFSIKVLATSTNQTYPPRLKDLRVIALA